MLRSGKSASLENPYHKVADVCLYYGSASLLRHIIVEVMTFETFCSASFLAFAEIFSPSIPLCFHS